MLCQMFSYSRIRFYITIRVEIYNEPFVRIYEVSPNVSTK